MTTLEEDKYNRARKRVECIKGFYVHLSVYLVINTAILLVIYMAILDDGESFWQISHFFTAIFWGLGVLFHAANTFDLNPFFGKKWEERQIRRYLEEDEKQSKKYQ